MYGPQDKLTPAQREALQIAVLSLIERCFADIGRFSADLPLDESQSVLVDASVLPPGFRPFYDLDFAQRFLAVLMTVAWKLESPHPYRLGCVAEEIAFDAVISTAQEILHGVWGMEEPEPEFDDGDEYTALDLESLSDSVNEDQDYRLLWTEGLIDAQDLDLENSFGFGGLRFSEWFNYFFDEEWNVHVFATRPDGWNPTSGPRMPGPKPA